MRDNLNPKRATKTFSFFRTLNNNRGEVRLCRSPEGEGGGGSGEGEGEGEGGAAAATLTAPTDWKATLDPSIKDHPSLANLATPADVAKSWVNAQSIIGKEKLPVPGKDSDPMQDGGNQEYNMVYDRLGRPSDPKAYQLPDVEGAPAVTPEVADSFKAEAHKLGLLPHQVAGLYKWNQENAKGAVDSNQQQLTQGLQESEAAMRKEYGTAFDANISSARSILQKFGGAEVLAALDKSGLGNDPHMIRMMVNISKQFGEDGATFVGDGAQQNILTPDEAKMEIDKIKGDKKGAYWNPAGENGQKQFTEAEHKVAVDRVAQLFSMAHPSK